MFKKNYKGLIRQCGLVIALGVMGVSSTAIAAVAASSHEFGDEKALNDICVKLCNFVAENFDIMEMRTGNVNLTSLKPDTLLTLLNEETYNKERILSKIDALINNTSENMLEIAALLRGAAREASPSPPPGAARMRHVSHSRPQRAPSHTG